MRLIYAWWFLYWLSGGQVAVGPFEAAFMCEKVQEKIERTNKITVRCFNADWSR